MLGRLVLVSMQKKNIMALVKIISNLQSNKLGQMSDIEAFSKGSLLTLSICSGLVTISAALLVLQTVVSFSSYLQPNKNLSTDLKEIIGPTVSKIGDSVASSLQSVSSSVAMTIDSYSTDSLLKNVK